MNNLLFFRLLSVLCFCLALLFLGCGDDDEDTPLATLMIVVVISPLLKNRVAQISLRARLRKT